MAEFKRSRLEKKNEERATKSTVVLGLLSAGVLVAVLIFGLPLLIRLSIFLGEIKSRRSAEVEEKVLPPLPPRLVVPFEATNSGKIAIRGFAEAGATVELLKNDATLETMPVADNGDFSFDEVELDLGLNDFLVIARTEEGGSSEPSELLKIIYDNEAPKLEMTNPSEASLTVDYADFDVGGKTEKGVSVSVNGRIAVVDDEGIFKLKVQLVAGKNEFEIVVSDVAGNETKKKIEIKYDI